MIIVAPRQGPKMIRSEQGALTNGTRRAILRSVAGSGPLGQFDPGSQAWIGYEEGSTDTRSVYEVREPKRWTQGLIDDMGKACCRFPETWSGHQ